MSALKQTQPSDQDDEEVEERAAILEFEAGYNRKDAEQEARQSHSQQSQPAQRFSAERFLAEDLPPKEALIENLVYRRDQIALAGRRRHGKTGFQLGLAITLSLGLPEFLKYPIRRKCNVAGFFLEDDAREIQDRLKRMLRGCGHDSSALGNRFMVITRQDFMKARIPISISDTKFEKFVGDRFREHKPELAIFDNLAQMVQGDYSNSKVIHKLAQFSWNLTHKHNTAVLVSAHPKKRTNNQHASPTLRDDPEGFFEEVMGSSHFVNSFGSLWGLERDADSDETIFVGGVQRYLGQQSLTVLTKNDDDWFEVVDEPACNLKLACNTNSRKKAWKLLPDTPFSFTEGFDAVKTVMKSKSTFHYWLNNSLVRLNLVEVQSNDHYQKKV